MRPVMDSYDANVFAPEAFDCPRCAQVTTQRFAGLCAACVEQLRTAMRREAAEIDAEYVPKMNVTANAVALRDD